MKKENIKSMGGIKILAGAFMFIVLMKGVFAFDTYINNTNIFVDDFLGVGTNVPNQTLHVNGTFSVYNNTGILGLFQSALGRVGIGTTMPSHKLNVVGDVNITGDLISKTIHEASSQGLVIGMDFNNGSVDGNVVLDSSSLNNHGTNEGATHTSTGSFNSGGAYVFDGTDDYINISYDSSLKVHNLTVMAWIKPNNLSEWQWVVGYPHNCTSYTGGIMEYGFWTDTSGRVHPRIDGDIKGNHGTLTLGAWNHVAVTSNSSTTNVHVNGVFVGNGTGDGSITYDNDCRVLIGANVDREYFNGTIDDVRVYDRVLSLDEIESIYYQRAEMGDSYVSQKDVYVDASGDVGIGTSTPIASAILDLTSTTKGFLPPRMNTTHRDVISSPADGLIVYDNTTEKISVREDGVWAEVLSNRDYYVASSSAAATPATGSFQNLALGTVNRDPGSNDAGANNYYRVPRTGMYMTTIRMRADGETGGADFGIGVHSTNADGNHFFWTGVDGNIARQVWTHTYVGHYSEGDELRPITYLDGTAMTFDAYEMTIVPLS